MSEQSAIYARFGFDLRGARQDLANAQDMVGKAHGKMAGAARGNSEAHESFLESEKRVENKMVGLAGSLAHAQSAGDALANSVEALGDTFNLSLAAGITVGVGVELFRSLHAAREEADKLNEEIDRLTADRGGTPFRGVAEMETRLASLQEKLAALSKEKGWFEAAKDYLSASQFVGGTGTYEGSEKRAEAIVAAIEQERAAIGAKAAALTEVMRLEVAGDERGAALAKIRIEYAEKLGAAYKAQNVPLAEQLKLQQALAEQKVNQDTDAKEGKELDAKQKAADAIEQKRLQGVSAIAEAEAKAAMDALRGEMSNAQKLADKEADALQAKSDAEKAEKEKSAKAERELDYALAEARRKDLEKEILAGNALFLKKQEEEKSARKKAADDAQKRLADELAARKRADDEAAAHRKQTLADAVDAELAGPDARRQAKRDASKRGRAEGKVKRKQDLDERGGKAAADMPKDELFGLPFETRLRVLGGRGEGKVKDAGGKELQGALKNAIQDAKILQDINTSIGAVRNARP